MKKQETAKEKIFKDLVQYLEATSGRKLEYGEGIITAYTLSNSQGNDVLELQTDFGDHLDFLVIAGGRPYSLGGSYIPRVKDWQAFAVKAKQCMDLIKKEKTVTEEVWWRQGRRVGGILYIPSKESPTYLALRDRIGSSFGLLSKKILKTRKLDLS